MTDPSWRGFLERWAAGRLGPMETAAVLERLRARETYILAHRQWACGAGERDVIRLLDAAAAEIGVETRSGERTGQA